MRIDLVSIFPSYFTPLELSLVGKAKQAGLIEVVTHDLRNWAHDRHKTTDDTPYGGGAGMVMKPEPWGEAFDYLVAVDNRRPTVIFPTPVGERFTQKKANNLADKERLIFACGRYEGIDQRVIDYAKDTFETYEISIGDYILNGGEVAALAIVEAVVRLIPGVVGNPESLIEESYSDGLLEYPNFTKPVIWRGREVPEVLLSGNHGRIADWRAAQSEERTSLRRPDLWRDRN
ncbi:MAG: tRNA (guanosine(37)-N1)-methyltransferase TrmD [Propionibacterium sp.]|nr:MAG: tRNA (guanosine(37)-N1)-methyltransferase TrmD [Propionibacterium sp.]